MLVHIVMRTLMYPKLRIVKKEPDSANILVEETVSGSLAASKSSLPILQMFSADVVRTRS